MGVRVAALLTCHNRVAQTLSCLENLQAQVGHDAHVDTVVLDAASTDGTPEGIRARFPDATVLQGTADQFWTRGMHVAFKHALDGDYDYYLWLNDDTRLDPEALATLLHTERRLRAREERPVVVGSTRDPDTGALTYGGVVRRSRLRPLRFELVPPRQQPRRCETMNGNCVLVPRDVVALTGILDPTFTHGIGDYDYGLRARRAGCSVWLAPGTVGTCARNPSQGLDSVREEARRLRGPKGLPPAEWAVFARRWGGPLWPVYVVSPYVRRLLRAWTKRPRAGHARK